MTGVRARLLGTALRLRAAGASKAPAGKAAGKKGKHADAVAAPVVSAEVRAATVVGANILKEGSDPAIKDDSEYPEWLWGLLEKRPALSELKRKAITTLSMPELTRYLKLDNRQQIKDKNLERAKV